MTLLPRNTLRLILGAVAAILLSADYNPAPAGGRHHPPPPPPPNWRGDGAGTTVPNDIGQHVDNFTGKSTEVGPYKGAGYHILNTVDFTFVGEETWTAKDGSKLYVTLSGQVFANDDPVFPYGFVATLTAIGGTKRLAGARGVAAMAGAFTGVPGEFYFDFEGHLDSCGR